MIECVIIVANKGDHLHILTFAHLHINEAFAHLLRAKGLLNIVYLV